MDDLSEQERLMIGIIREQSGEDDFRLLVKRQDGAWDITMSTAPHDVSKTARGTGATFNEAWDNIDPAWA